MFKEDFSPIDSWLNELSTIAIERGGPVYVDITKAIRHFVSWAAGDTYSALDWAVQKSHLPFLPLTHIIAPPILQLCILVSSEERKAHKKALEIAEDLIPFLKKYHNRKYLFEAYLLLGVILYKMEHPDRAISCTLKAMEYYSSGTLLWNYNSITAVLNQLLLNTDSEDERLVILRKHLDGNLKTVQPVTNLQILTLREVEILTMLDKNLLNKEIANELFISESTVKRHIANIYKKLNINNRREAMSWLRDQGNISA
jgi:DNA-binding CsgD family transcriptional regulator